MVFGNLPPGEHYDVPPVPPAEPPVPERMRRWLEQRQAQAATVDLVTDEATQFEAEGGEGVPISNWVPQRRPSVWFQSRGPDVVELQRLLTAIGIYDPDIPEDADDDGHFGPATEAAVRGFQRAAGLNATAIVDEPTWDALYSAERAA